MTCSKLDILLMMRLVVVCIDAQLKNVDRHVHDKRTRRSTDVGRCSTVRKVMTYFWSKSCVSYGGAPCIIVVRVGFVCGVGGAAAAVW